MITIGIPKGLLYYRYKILWKEFFNELNIKYTLSDESNFKTKVIECAGCPSHCEVIIIKKDG